MDLQKFTENLLILTIYMDKVAIGKYGEDLACEFLKSRGYKIIERNFRIRGGEIDVVAKDGITLVYVEVKTRSQYMFGTPEESVTPFKLRFLQRAAKFYRLKRKNLNLPQLERIDVISVDISEPKAYFKLIKNAGF